MSIITVTGVLSGSGVTMTTQCIAEQLARSGRSTIFVSEHGLEYLPNDTGMCLDMYRSALSNEVITSSELDAAMGTYTADLRALAGCQNPSDLRYYLPEMINTLCNHLGEMAEYIVIDGGSNINSGFYIGALEVAERNILLLTQQERAVKRFEKRREVLATLDVTFSMIANLYSEQPKFYSTKQLQEILEIDCLGTIPDVGFGWQCEHEKTSLLTLSKEYEKALKVIVAQITGEDIDPRSNMRKLFGRKGR